MQKRILMILLLGTSLTVSACSDDSTAQNNDSSADVTEDIESNDVCSNCEPPDGGLEDVGEPDADAPDGNDAPDGDDAPDGGDAPDADEEDALNLIVAHDQIVAPAESDQVTIAEASVEADGFVVVYAECTNCLVPGPGEIVGSQAIAAGEHTDVTVVVDHNLHNNQTYYALLHDDVNADGVLDYAVGTGGEDVSLKENSEPIMDAFLVNAASLIATNQTLSDLSTLVTLSEVYNSNSTGWAAIREGRCTDEGAVIGLAALLGGESINAQATLKRPAQTGETLCARLHEEGGELGQFEYDPINAPSADVPVRLADDAFVQAEFVVTVPEGLPAVRYTLSNPDDLGYVVDSVEPAYYNNGLSETANPFLGLRSGWRYEFVNLAATAHPFEFIHKGASSGGLEQPDAVRLSQAVAGSGEADAEVNWVEDANKFRFTVAGNPWTGSASIDGYRSASAPVQVRGDVGVYIQ